MIVTVENPAVRDPGFELTLKSFDDLTGGKECLSIFWNDDGVFSIQFAVNLSAAEIVAVRRRASARNPSEETITRNAQAAIADLRTYLALAAPTNAQTVAAVRLLCRVSIALLRLQLRDFQATD